MIILIGCGTQKDENTQESTPQISQETENVVINDFKLTDLAKQTIDINTKNGGLKVEEMPNLVIFITPECEPCQAELPYISTIAQKYKNDIKVIVIALNASESDLINFSDKFNLSSELAIGGEVLAKSINIEALPTIIISDKNGNKVRTYLGLAPMEMLERDIELAVKR